MDELFDIVIIGGGASGTILASQLALQNTAALRVAIIEPRSTLGQGAAYSASSVHLLLNVPSGKMSALPDKPHHFHEWLNTHLLQPVDDSSFVPRRLYGYYLEKLYRTALNSASPGFECRHFETEAIDLEFSEQQGVAEIKLGDGSLLKARKAVLAIGNLPGEYPVRKALSFYRSTRYIHQPWKPGVLEDVRPKDTVLLVGAGLTAVDMAIQLLNSRHEGPVHSLSRHGLLPRVHAASAPWNDLWLREPWPDKISTWLKKVRNEIIKAESAGSNWRAVLDTLRPFSQDIWHNLPQAEKSRFYRHLRPHWEVHRHRLAPVVAGQIEAGRAKSRFFLHAGRILTFEEQGDFINVLIRERKTGERFVLKVNHVINCTGPRADITKFQHPLLVNLLASGLIYHDSLALGIDATKEGAVIGFRRPPSNWLFTLGTPLKGILGESTAIPEIRVQAANLAVKLLANPKPA